MFGQYPDDYVASLAAQLPAESRCMRALNPSLEWTLDQYLLAAIEYDLRVLAWQNSADGQKGRNAPKPPQTPARRAEIAERIRKTDRAYVDAVLGMRGGDDG